MPEQQEQPKDRLQLVLQPYRNRKLTIQDVRSMLVSSADEVPLQEELIKTCERIVEAMFALSGFSGRREVFRSQLVARVTIVDHTATVYFDHPDSSGKVHGQLQVWLNFAGYINRLLFVVVHTNPSY